MATSQSMDKLLDLVRQNVTKDYAYQYVVGMLSVEVSESAMQSMIRQIEKMAS